MRKYLIYILLGLLTFILIVVLVFSFSRKQTTYQINTIATPTPFAVPPIQFQNQPFQIVSIDPADNSTNISLNPTIKVVFNKEVPTVDFQIIPSTPFTIKKQADGFLVTFQKALNPKTLYIYGFFYSKSPLLPSFSFTTQGEGNVKYTNTSIDIAKTAIEYQLKNQPDLYLQNHSPYTTSDFSLNYIYENNQGYFTVTLLGDDKISAKQKFTDWLTYIGLTNEQINTLDIRYQ